MQLRCIALSVLLLAASCSAATRFFQDNAFLEPYPVCVGALLSLGVRSVPRKGLVLSCRSTRAAASGQVNGALSCLLADGLIMSASFCR